MGVWNHFLRPEHGEPKRTRHLLFAIRLVVACEFDSLFHIGQRNGPLTFSMVVFMSAFCSAEVESLDSGKANYTVAWWRPEEFQEGPICMLPFSMLSGGNDSSKQIKIEIVSFPFTSIIGLETSGGPSFSNGETPRGMNRVDVYYK